MYEKWDAKIVDVLPCRDLLIFVVKEIGQEEEQPDELLFLDARTFECSPANLSKIVFFEDFSEHRIVIGEIKEKGKKEKTRLSFVLLNESTSQRELLDDECSQWQSFCDTIFP